MDQYGSLNRAQLSFDYLHTNSTTHEFLFGAIAELIDNSRDAGATELDIYAIKDESLRGGYMMCFADNGCGMLPEETRSVIIFGRSLKKNAESSSIGMYGNGLKSGSMRIGNDMILFTKKDGVMTCLFLSRSFHEEEKIDEVIVPMPAFRGPEKTPIIDLTDDCKKHELEMSIILQYSPFKCQKDLFSQFDKIKGSSGTLVIIYNMKLLDNGEAELDINTDPKDILLTHPDLLDNAGVDVDVELVDERRSLRAYVSILYADPRMKVYLQGRKVQTKRLISNLANRRMYNFASKTFKTRAETDVAKAKEDVKIAELRAKEAESKARDMEARFGNNLDAEQLRAVRKARNTAMDLREQVKQRQNALVRKQRALKDPKTLTFYFGLNLENRACDGMFVYNCSRLIKMYQRIGPQQDSGMTCRGVVGVVNVPYLVLEPTHNKQDFADAKEFRALMRAMADHLMQYWDDLKMDENDLYEFWGKFGYLSAKWRDPPSQEEVFIRRRAMHVKPCVQCDQCLKWRILPFQQKRIGQEVPDNWQCNDNPDPRHKRCSEPEEHLDIPMGVLKRKIKTKEQRQAELEEQIRKKQVELEQVKRVSRDMSSTTAADNATGGGGGNNNNQQNKANNKSSSPDKRRPSVARTARRNSSEEESEASEDTPPPRRKTASKSTAQPVVNKKSTPNASTAAAATTSSSAAARRSSGPIVTKSSVTAAAATAASKQKAVQNKKAAETRAKTNLFLSRSSSSESEEQMPKTGSSTRGKALASKRPFSNGDIDESPPVKKSTTLKETTVTAATSSSRSTRQNHDNNTPVIESVVGGSVASSATVVATEDVTVQSTTKATTTPASMPTVKMEPGLAMADLSLLNQAVDVREGSEILSGTVIEVQDDRVLVHFDKQSNDRWFYTNNEQLIFKGTSVVNGSSTSESVVNQDEYHKIVDNYRNTLRYFLPPDWPISKDSIYHLSSKELAEFPMEKFFDNYEEGLRQLFSNVQTEADSLREKLDNCRSLMRQLLAHAEQDDGMLTMDSEVVEGKFEEWLRRDKA